MSLAGNVERYLYQRVCRNSEGHKSIPTERELCSLFDVSHITVRAAIAKLLERQELCRLPNRKSPVTPIYPLVVPPLAGILSEYGTRCYTHPKANVIFAELALELGRKNYAFEFLNFQRETGMSMEKEISPSTFDALIWFDPSPSAIEFINSLLERGYPVMSIMHVFDPRKTVPVSNSILYDYGVFERKFAEYAAKYKKPLFVDFYALSDDPFFKYRPSLRESLEKMVRVQLENISEIENYLESGEIDAVFSNGGNALHSCMELLQKSTHKKDIAFHPFTLPLSSLVHSGLEIEPVFRVTESVLRKMGKQAAGKFHALASGKEKHFRNILISESSKNKAGE